MSWLADEARRQRRLANDPNQCPTCGMWCGWGTSKRCGQRVEILRPPVTPLLMQRYELERQARRAPYSGRNPGHHGGIL